MELIFAVVTILGLFGALDLAALKWGANSRRAKGYDPRTEWEKQN